MIVRPLTEYCTLNMGQSPDSKTYNTQGNGLPFYQGNADFGETHPITRVWCSAPVKTAENGDILISVRAPIGAMNTAVERCCIGRGLAALTPIRNKCSKQFLYYALQSKVDSLIAQGTGSTFKAISKKVLEATYIPAYSSDEQEHISNTIGRVDRAVAARRNQLILLDQLVKSRFVELFGDPVSNPKDWNIEPLGKRCGIITGNTPPRSEPENYGKYIEWIKSDNINTPFTFITKAQECLSEAGFEKCRFVEAGSILMTCIAGSIDCIGNVAVTDRRVAFNQQINAIVPEQDEVLYLYWLMQLSKPMIHRTINMALKGMLSKSQLSEIVFPFPPITLQEQFVAFVEQTDKSKLAVQKSLEELEILKKSLMQQYFG